MPVPSETLAPRPLLRDEVLRKLRDAIVDGTFAPDEQLRDAELATWLGVSRTPVREALLELGRSGLVRTSPGRSTVVAPVDPAAVRDAQVVVAALHRAALEAAVPRLTPTDIARMRSVNADVAAAQQAGDVDATLAADHAFHDITLAASGNAAIRAVLAQYEPVLRRAERLRFASHEGRDSVARHEQMITLCERGDAAGAAALAEQTWQSLTVEELPASDPSDVTEEKAP
ncbi:GntR family transcriptional regulator [Microbacterium sp. NPDC089189]|uniref:GntR family transcriptional regulator n=1 Tax=Microbacterium sp. NPDC089189 TaxID=3154972 RepID=UPI0034442720